MFYLRRTNSPDIEGPYSLEYLRQMARDGKLFASDQLLNAETNEELMAHQILDVPASAPPMGGMSENPYAPPPTKPGITPAQTAIIALIIIASICILPVLLLIPTAGRVLLPDTDMAQAERVLRKVVRATEAYCNDYDGFFPSGMGSRDVWINQLDPYLDSDVSLEFENGDQVEANKNLNNIRLSSVIDPYQTVMFYVLPEPGKGDMAAVANVDGQVGGVPADRMKQSVDSGIYNVPIGR